MIERVWNIVAAAIVVLLIDDLLTYPDAMLTERGIRKVIKTERAKRKLRPASED